MRGVFLFHLNFKYMTKNITLNGKVFPIKFGLMVLMTFCAENNLSFEELAQLGQPDAGDKMKQVKDLLLIQKLVFAALKFGHELENKPFELTLAQVGLLFENLGDVQKVLEMMNESFAVPGETPGAGE